jgi:hypothetical protein
MTKEQLFIINTGIFIVSFTFIILWFAWCVVVAWRVSRVKRKRTERILDETEYFTPDWEKEIHRINRDHAETVADLERDRHAELIELHKRRNKEESE